MTFFSQKDRFDSAAALLSPLALLVAWAWVCHAHVFPEQLLVSPGRVVTAFVEMGRSGDLQEHVRKSLYRLGWGFSLGAVLGLGFGIAMGLSKTVENFCGPFFNFMRQIPTIAFVPMLILLLGVDETLKIAVVAKGAFYPVALASFEAVIGIPRGYFDVARVYRLPSAVLIWEIVLPATIPPVLTGLRLSLSRSWMVLVAAELLAADSGVGQMMEMGRQMFRIDTVMAGVIVTGSIGFLLDRSFKSFEAHLLRWRHL